MRDFYLPKDKYSCLAWLTHRFPSSRWGHLRKATLQAIIVKTVKVHYDKFKVNGMPKKESKPQEISWLTYTREATSCH